MTTATSRAEIREAIDDLKTERDELDCDLVGLKYDLEQLVAEIAAKRARKAQIKDELKALRAAK
jgi:chromosome segregation ATPase